ncbi:MAG: hypothetical protein RL020_1749, partial [Pseudomonadota bacterium]
FNSGDSYDIMGWRKTNDRVAAFYFTSLPDSYAARTGRPDNVGVIGVALFRRKYEAPISYVEPPVYPRWQENSRSEDSATLAQAAPSAAAPNLAGAAAEARGGSAGRMVPAPLMKDKSLGTGHGRSVESSVQIAQFERQSSTPDEVITIYYDSQRNLVSRGVLAYSPPIAANPFPNQFVADPPRRW